MEEFSTCFQGTGSLVGEPDKSVYDDSSPQCRLGARLPRVLLEYKPLPVRAALGFGKISQSR